MPRLTATLAPLPRHLGARVLAQLRGGQSLLRLFALTLREAFGRPAPRRRAMARRGELLPHLHAIGNASLFFVIVTLSFVSMVSVYQVCLQVSRITGDLSAVGPEFILFMVHETGPTITALMLATRIGAGIAAEIGAMVVTEQVDALRMSGVSPVAYLVVPRFWATLIMLPVLALFAGTAGIASGAAMAFFGFGLNPRVFLNVSRITGWHGLVGLSKCSAYGATIPVVAAHCGLSTVGGSEGVGWAATRAVVYASLVVLLLDFVISSLAFSSLPIGQ